MTSATGTVRSRWILAAVSMALFCVQIDYFAMNLAGNAAARRHVGRRRDRPDAGGAGALLLPAGVLVLLVARSRTAALSANPHGNSAE